MQTVIANTAKGRRVWIQGTCAKGWPVGARYDVTYEEWNIVLTLSPTGKRKVAKGKGGIIDLTSQKVTRWAQDSESAQVIFDAPRGRILFVRG